MEHLDWTTFDKRINIKAFKEVLFISWTSQDELEKWFLSQAQFYTKKSKKRDRHSQVEVGDTYKWMWYGSDFCAEGEVLKNNGKDYLEFTFLGCIVSVEVKNEEGEYIVEIIQRDIPLDEESRMNLFVGCSRGWTFYATNLKSILEGGIDLRNKNKKVKGVINS